VIVLIRGESGTGKELVARAIYQHSPRSDGPFLAVNCAALPEALLESELFGHEKGSFTGADRRHIGKFEQCSGGTLFLDEVGDMSPAIQSKFLRVLQEQKFERVGGTKTLETDVRIIAATNRPLEKMVADGHFREDLFYRLNGFMIHLPALRERTDDVPLLLEYYLLRLSKELGKEVTGFSADALQLLASYSWPGNVRELQSVLRQAIVHATGPLIVPEWLPQSLRADIATAPAPATAAKAAPGTAPQPEHSHADLDRFIDSRLAADTGNLYAESLELMERTLLTRVLNETDGNQSKAAAILGITRGCLRGKIRSLGIAIQRSVGVKGIELEEEAATV
jgi:DNA-binding NtrC family response regulator